MKSADSITIFKIPFHPGNRPNQITCMGVTTATTGDSPPAYMLPGVNLFASGVYRGKPWTPGHVRQMRVNAGRLAKLITPPSAPGHEDDEGWQEFVRTDEPAAGWVDPKTVHTVPDPDHPGHLILRGDIVNVPLEMAQKILSGEYSFGSSEIYDSFKDDFGKDYGRALRKFSYLGSEVPQCKRLGRLPMPVPMQSLRVFSERRPGVTIRVHAVRNGSQIHTYAETTVMDRTQMMAAIQAAMPGIAQSTLDGLSDDALADLAKNIPTASPVADPNAVQPVAPSGMMADMTREELIAALTEAGEDPAELEGMEDADLQALLDELEGGETAPEGEVETMGDPATMTRDELIAELTAAGQDAAALQDATDDALRAMYAELIGGATATAPAAAAVPAAIPMSERRRTMPATKLRPASTFAERESNKLLMNMRNLNRFAEQTNRRLKAEAATSKRRKVAAFCEQLIKDGLDTPAGVAVKTKTLLLGLDDTMPVHRFSDGKATRKVTALDLKMAALLTLPKIHTYGERFPIGGGSAGSVDGSAEEQKVARFAETLPDNAIKAGGYRSRANFVEKFSEARKKNSDLTAEQYLGLK